MLADQVDSIMAELRQRKVDGRGLPSTAISIYGFRKLEEICLNGPHQEVDGAIKRFKQLAPHPMNPVRFVMLRAKVEQQAAGI